MDQVATEDIETEWQEANANRKMQFKVGDYKDSRVAPNAITEYRPRETNVISDYLAGQASAWILDNPNDRRCSTGGPFRYQLIRPMNCC